MCSTLAGPGDVILLDADSHASIYAGVRLSGAEIIRFKHSDPDDLAKRMRRLGDRAGQALIIAEGIYSMLGDVAPLKEIAAVKREYGGYLLLDEAHSMGALGSSGRGAAQDAGIEADVDFTVGTFSKSLGSIGGFCISPHAELEAIRFSTREALRIIGEEPERRTRLWDNADRLYQGLKALGAKVGPTASPVVAVEMEDRLRQPGDPPGLPLDQFPAAQQCQRSPLHRADRQDCRRLRRPEGCRAAANLPEKVNGKDPDHRQWTIAR
jgi:8-amino-7-oxononanoate synthase